MADSLGRASSPFDVGSVYEIEREEEYDPLVYEVESSPTGFRGFSGNVQMLSEYHDFDLLDQPVLCLPSPTCYCSSLREVDINMIKNAYNISESVDLRIPLENEGPDCNRPNEVIVYEAFFALGLRDSVPSLVAKMTNFIGISPSQLNPHAWRILIAIQVFSEIYSVSLGLEEVLFVYFFKCYDSVNHWYLIQKRRPDSSPLVYDLDRQVRYKTPYEKQWHKKFLFMRVGRDPGYPVTWFPRVVECGKFPEGVDGVTRAFDFTKEQREVLFLTSFFALEKSSIWGYEMSTLDAVAGDGSIGDDALELFREAMSDIPAGTIAPPLQTEQPSSHVASKRSVTAANLNCQPARTTKRKSPAFPGGSLLNAKDHSIALGNLSKQVFSHDREALNKLGHVAILEKSQHHLMEVISVCSHVKTELDALTEEVARLKEANQLLKKDKEAEILLRDSLITAKEAEGEALKDQVYDLTLLASLTR